MYFKQKFFRLTKFQRKIPMRRKHLHNWLVYFNFLYSWLGEYRYFKAFYKSVLNQNLFKYNSIALNYSSFSKTSLFPSSLFSSLKGSKILKNQTNPSVPNNSTLSLTSLSKGSSLQSTSAVQYLYSTSQKIHTPHNVKNTSYSFSDLVNLITLLQLLILKEVYRIFTLTLLLQ